MTEEKYPLPKFWLDIPLCENIYETYRELARVKKISYPLPEFSTRYSGRLESIVGSVNLRSFLAGYNIVEVSTLYFVRLVKSQAFLDGNKRMAILFANTFLIINGFQLTLSQSDFGRIAIALAKAGDIPDEEAFELVLPIFQANINRFSK